jgi:hypothetical protein
MVIISITSFLVPDGDAGDGQAALSISGVSRRTGIPVAGLRNWEQRHVCDCSLCRLADGGGGEPAEPLGHRLRAADDGAYVAGVVGRAP